MEDQAAANGTADAAAEHHGHHGGDPVIFYVEGVGISAVGAAGMALNALAVIVLARQGCQMRGRFQGT